MIYSGVYVESRNRHWTLTSDVVSSEQLRGQWRLPWVDGAQSETTDRDGTAIDLPEGDPSSTNSEYTVA